MFFPSSVEEKTCKDGLYYVMSHGFLRSADIFRGRRSNHGRRRLSHLREEPAWVHLVNNIEHLATRAAIQGMHHEKQSTASRTCPIRRHGTLPIILSTNTCIWYHNNARKGECGTHPQKHSIITKKARPD